MNIKYLEDNYETWVKAAYWYYLHPEDEKFFMSDYTWSMMARDYFLNKHLFFEDKYSIIRDEGFEGSTLGYLREEDYPDYVRK